MLTWQNQRDFSCLSFWAMLQGKETTLEYTGFVTPTPQLGDASHLHKDTLSIQTNIPFSVTAQLWWKSWNKEDISICPAEDRTETLTGRVESVSLKTPLNSGDVLHGSGIRGEHDLYDTQFSFWESALCTNTAMVPSGYRKTKALEH